MLDFKPFQTVKISTVISYKYLKSLFFYSYFPIPPQQTHEAPLPRRRTFVLSESAYSVVSAETDAAENSSIKHSSVAIIRFVFISSAPLKYVINLLLQLRYYTLSSILYTILFYKYRHILKVQSLCAVIFNIFVRAVSRKADRYGSLPSLRNTYCV